MKFLQIQINRRQKLISSPLFIAAIDANWKMYYSNLFLFQKGGKSLVKLRMQVKTKNEKNQLGNRKECVYLNSARNSVCESKSDRPESRK